MKHHVFLLFFEKRLTTNGKKRGRPKGSKNRKTINRKGMMARILHGDNSSSSVSSCQDVVSNKEKKMAVRKVVK